MNTGVAQDNTQTVLRASNKVTLQQCWFNEQRTQKPQTFATAAAAALDPTAGGGPGSACDFCSWRELTAEDSWGRVEGPHAVSASNLFKWVPLGCWSRGCCVPHPAVPRHLLRLAAQRPCLTPPLAGTARPRRA